MGERSAPGVRSEGAKRRSMNKHGLAVCATAVILRLRPAASAQDDRAC
jgi:hypothetical protein